MKFLISFSAKNSDHSNLEYSGKFELARQYAKQHAEQINADCIYTIKVEKETKDGVIWADVDEDGNIEGGGQAD